MRRVALPAVALVAALGSGGCASTEQFVAECRTYVGTWNGGPGGTEDDVMRCAEQRRSDRNARTAETWAGLFLLPVVILGGAAMAAAPTAACQTVSEPYRGGYRTRTVCW